MHRFKLIVAALLLVAISPAAAAGASLWRVSIETQPFGPVEFHLQIDIDNGSLAARSLSGSVSVLEQLPRAGNVAAGLMAFSAEPSGDDSYTGTITAPWEDGNISLTIDGDELSAQIDDGFFAGTLRGKRVSEATPVRDYAALLVDFDRVVAAKVFSPADLQRPAYLKFRSQLGEVAALANDDLDILFGFSWLWQNDPFSHFQFKRSHQSAAEMFAMFDNYRVGFDAATVEFVDDIAILTVRTMMGADTIEQIVAAYGQVADADPSALIIDLRGNGGGAFAVKPLVEHVIDEPVDAGFFISQVWNRQHDSPPSRAQAFAAKPWEGWSIIGFWKAVQETDIVRVQFRPAEPNFDGPVFVLLDERSASATELAADALRSSGVTTLVGRQSAGEMLSQSMFDVGDGFIVSLPVADYYSVAHGRIEAVGVPVDIETDPEQAMDTALKLARNTVSRTN
ncbi:MAG: S41 family peptidase [Woeseiaceae bacterium]